MADFCGGLASRRVHVFLVNATAQWVGLLGLVALAVGRGEAWPSATTLAWAVGAGFGGAVGITLLYRALAVGQMGIAAPVTAVLSAGVPVLVAAVVQGLPNPAQVLGFGLALVGVWFIAQTQETVGRPAGLPLALVAGLGLGVYLTLMSRAGAEGGVFWPLVVARAVSAAVLLGLVLWRRPEMGAARQAWPVMLLAGALDAGGNTLFLLASQAGRLDVAAVLSSLYPAATVTLAWLILRERLTRPQTLGMVAVLAAVVLISL
ncbi:MAG: DMT family transporter [Anaerolineae bacterium]|nr:DMT family transporter [Anaerolineae bacterium]